MSQNDFLRWLLTAPDDAVCRWLCESAGQRTREQERALARARKALGGQA